MGILFKVYYKIIRKAKINSIFKIKAGPLKGYVWHVSIPDNRYLLGNYEPAMANIIEKAVRKNFRFVDIGANAGYFSLLAHKGCMPDKKPISIEPNPENIHLLKAHFRLNNIEAFDLEEMAISNQSGVIQFSNSDNLAANTYKQESSVYKNSTIEVKTNTLDYIAEKYNLDKFSLVKIDVEGAELDVLQGGYAFIKKYHPNILLATHNCHVANVKEDCLAYLKELGYSFEPIEDNKIEGQADFLCTKIT